ncbi:MAG: hypothetical protein KDC44_21945, partial [Phaeodactylibacter sp.]|nr:hypothetical protein [Phaeodactylibacter sp.]
KIAILWIGISCFAACKNYEEGPYFSLQTKKARVTNTWEVEGLLDADGNDISVNVNFYQLSFEGDGAAHVYILDGTTPNEILSGTWEFTDGKDTFSWQLEGDSTLFYYNPQETFDIYRLTGNQFWLIDKDNGKLFLKAL